MISGDSDFAMGIGYDKCFMDLMVSSLSHDKKKGMITQATVSTGQSSVQSWTIEKIKPPNKDPPFPRIDKVNKDSGEDVKDKNGNKIEIHTYRLKYPYFEGIHNPHMRAMLALISGCDVTPGRLKRRRFKISI